ncbi:MAG: hypothetical protein ACFFAU_03355 [Candidatus Hodarchaeota archaeon]
MSDYQENRLRTIGFMFVLISDTIIGLSLLLAFFLFFSLLCGECILLK